MTSNLLNLLGSTSGGHYILTPKMKFTKIKTPKRLVLQYFKSPLDISSKTC